MVAVYCILIIYSVKEGSFLRSPSIIHFFSPQCNVLLVGVVKEKYICYILFEISVVCIVTSGSFAINVL